MGANFFIIVHEFWKGFGYYCYLFICVSIFVSLVQFLFLFGLLPAKKPFCQKISFPAIFVLFLERVELWAELNFHY